MDGIIFDSLPKLRIVNSPLIIIDDVDIHTHTTLARLIWSPLCSTCGAHLPSNVSIVYLWSMNMRSAPPPTHPPARPRTDARLHPLLPRHPPPNQPTNHPSDGDSSQPKVSCKTSSSKSRITSTAASCFRGSMNPETV